MPRKIINGKLKPRTKAEREFRNKQIEAGIKSERSRKTGLYLLFLRLGSDPDLIRQHIKEKYKLPRRRKEFGALITAMRKLK